MTGTSTPPTPREPLFTISDGLTFYRTFWRKFAPFMLFTGLLKAIPAYLIGTELTPDLGIGQGWTAIVYGLCLILITIVFAYEVSFYSRSVKENRILSFKEIMKTEGSTLFYSLMSFAATALVMMIGLGIPFLLCFFLVHITDKMGLFSTGGLPFFFCIMGGACLCYLCSAYFVKNLWFAPALAAEGSGAGLGLKAARRLAGGYSKDCFFAYIKNTLYFLCLGIFDKFPVLLAQGLGPESATLYPKTTFMLYGVLFCIENFFVVPLSLMLPALLVRALRRRRERETV